MGGVWVVAATVIAAVGVGGVLGALVARRSGANVRTSAGQSALVCDSLRRMDAALDAVSLDSLDQRGGWDRALFESVLDHLEREAPIFQTALATYLSTSGARPATLVTGLLAVDRLSAAYTTWTRLFPPRRQDDSMFVLSLLHDLGEQVEDVLGLLENGGG